MTSCFYRLDGTPTPLARYGIHPPDGAMPVSAAPSLVFAEAVEESIAHGAVLVECLRCGDPDRYDDYVADEGLCAVEQRSAISDYLIRDPGDVALAEEQRREPLDLGLRWLLHWVDEGVNEWSCKWWGLPPSGKRLSDEASELQRLVEAYGDEVLLREVRRVAASVPPPRT